VPLCFQSDFFGGGPNTTLFSCGNGDFKALRKLSASKVSMQFGAVHLSFLISLLQAYAGAIHRETTISRVPRIGLQHVIAGGA
jgi:hypothetical protein